MSFFGKEWWLPSKKTRVLRKFYRYLVKIHVEWWAWKLHIFSSCYHWLCSERSMAFSMALFDLLWASLWLFIVIASSHMLLFCLGEKCSTVQCAELKPVECLKMLSLSRNHKPEIFLSRWEFVLAKIQVSRTFHSPQPEV